LVGREDIGGAFGRKGVVGGEKARAVRKVVAREKEKSI